MLNQITSFGVKLEILVLLPICNQGSGKTFYFKNVIQPILDETTKVSYKIISSEQTNQKLIQTYSIEFPEMSRDELYRHTRPFYRKFYDQQIEDTFLEIYGEVLDKTKLGSDLETYLVYVDKNHPLNHRSQAPIHRRFRQISCFDQLKFVSVNLVALEVQNEQGRVLRKPSDISRWGLSDQVPLFRLLQSRLRSRQLFLPKRFGSSGRSLLQKTPHFPEIFLAVPQRGQILRFVLRAPGT